MKRLLLALTMIMSGFLLASSAPAAAVQTPTFSAAGSLVEVVNRLPTSWPVPAALRFVDGFTASRAKIVTKCDSLATRCVTIKVGRLGTEGKTVLLGHTKGNTIIIDIHKACAYRVCGAKTRLFLLTHELGHLYGLGHSSANNLMYPYVRRNGKLPAYAFTADQQRKLSYR